MRVLLEAERQLAAYNISHKSAFSVDRQLIKEEKLGFEPTSIAYIAAAVIPGLENELVHGPLLQADGRVSHFC